MFYVGDFLITESSAICGQIIFNVFLHHWKNRLTGGNEKEGQMLRKLNFPI